MFKPSLLKQMVMLYVVWKRYFDAQVFSLECTFRVMAYRQTRFQDWVVMVYIILKCIPLRNTWKGCILGFFSCNNFFPPFFSLLNTTYPRQWMNMHPQMRQFIQVTEVFCKFDWSWQVNCSLVFEYYSLWAGDFADSSPKTTEVKHTVIDLCHIVLLLKNNMVFTTSLHSTSNQQWCILNHWSLFCILTNPIQGWKVSQQLLGERRDKF